MQKPVLGRFYPPEDNSILWGSPLIYDLHVSKKVSDIISCHMNKKIVDIVVDDLAKPF